MIVFLIDADNLSSPAWVNEAITTIEATEGPIAVRRAYGSAENLKGLADSLRDWAIRPFLNVYLTKNTTDMALAVDAMELAFREFKLVLEPGGAVALAAALTGKLPVKGRAVAVVCSGGNVDHATFKRALDRASSAVA